MFYSVRFISLGLLVLGMLGLPLFVSADSEVGFDPVVDATHLHQALDPFLNDYNAVFYILENRTQSQIQEIAQEFANLYSDDWNGRSLRSVISLNLSGDQEVRALRAYDGLSSRPPTTGGFGGGAAGTCDDASTPTIWQGGYWATDPPLLPCFGRDCLECGWCGMLILLQRIFYFLMSVAVYLIVPFRILWGGFQIATAGTAGNISKGREIILRTVIGLMILLGAFLIVQTFLWLLGNPSGVNWPNFACPKEIVPFNTVQQREESSGILGSLGFSGSSGSSVFSGVLNSLGLSRFSGTLESSQLSGLLNSPEFSNLLASPEVSRLLSSPEVNNLLRSPELSAVLNSSDFSDLSSVLNSQEFSDLTNSSEFSAVLNSPELSAVLRSPRFSELLKSSETVDLTRSLGL